MQIKIIILSFLLFTNCHKSDVKYNSSISSNINSNGIEFKSYSRKIVRFRESDLKDFSIHDIKNASVESQTINGNQDSENIEIILNFYDYADIQNNIERFGVAYDLGDHKNYIDPIVMHNRYSAYLLCYFYKGKQPTFYDKIPRAKILLEDISEEKANGESELKGSFFGAKFKVDKEVIRKSKSCLVELTADDDNKRVVYRKNGLKIIKKNNQHLLNYPINKKAFGRNKLFVYNEPQIVGLRPQIPNTSRVTIQDEPISDKQYEEMIEAERRYDALLDFKSEECIEGQEDKWPLECHELAYQVVRVTGTKEGKGLVKNKCIKYESFCQRFNTGISSNPTEKCWKNESSVNLSCDQIRKGTGEIPIYEIADKIVLKFSNAQKCEFDPDNITLHNVAYPNSIPCTFNGVPKFPNCEKFPGLFPCISIEQPFRDDSFGEILNASFVYSAKVKNAYYLQLNSSKDNKLLLNLCVRDDSSLNINDVQGSLEYICGDNSETVHALGAEYSSLDRSAKRLIVWKKIRPYMLWIGALPLLVVPGMVGPYLAAIGVSQATLATLASVITVAAKAGSAVGFGFGIYSATKIKRARLALSNCKNEECKMRAAIQLATHIIGTSSLVFGTYKAAKFISPKSASANLASIKEQWMFFKSLVKPTVGKGPLSISSNIQGQVEKMNKAIGVLRSNTNLRKLILSKPKLNDPNILKTKIEMMREFATMAWDTLNVTFFEQLNMLDWATIKTNKDYVDALREIGKIKKLPGVLIQELE